MITANDFKDALAGVSDIEIDRVITNVLAMAALYAPGINTPSFQDDPTKMAALKAIVSKAVIYEVKSGNGTVQTESAGPYSHTMNSQMPQSSLYFSPQQIQALKSLVAVSVSTGFYSIQMTDGRCG